MSLSHPAADAQSRIGGACCAVVKDETAAEAALTDARTGAGRSHDERAGFDPRRSPSPRPEVGPAQRATRGGPESPAGRERRSGKLDRTAVYPPAAAFGTPLPDFPGRGLSAQRKNQPRGSSADTDGVAHRQQGQRGDGTTDLLLTRFHPDGCERRGFERETPPHCGGDPAGPVAKPAETEGMRATARPLPGEPAASQAAPQGVFPPHDPKPGNVLPATRWVPPFYRVIRGGKRSSLREPIDVPDAQVGLPGDLGPGSA